MRKIMRVSNKKKRGKSTGMNSRFSSTGSRKRVMDRTNSILRRKEREYCNEVRKAYRAGSELPFEPHPTEGGFYAD